MVHGSWYMVEDSRCIVRGVLAEVSQALDLELRV